MLAIRNHKALWRKKRQCCDAEEVKRKPRAWLVLLSKHLWKTRLGICIYKTSLLHWPEEYIGFTPSWPPTFCNKIVPMTEYDYMSNIQNHKVCCKLSRNQRWKDLGFSNANPIQHFYFNIQSKTKNWQNFIIQILFKSQTLSMLLGYMQPNSTERF